MVMWGYGEIVTANEGAYSTKPRPVLIMQNPQFSTGSSVIVAPLTSAQNDEVNTRIAVLPNRENGLDRACFVEVDKISAIRASAIGTSVGHLEEDTLAKVTALAIALISPAKV